MYNSNCPSTYRYGASALAIAANSGSHLSPFASNFSLLYNNSSLVSVAYSAFGAKNPGLASHLKNLEKKT